MVSFVSDQRARIHYLVLAKGIRHASEITLDLDIHLAKLLESAGDRKLKLLICQGRNETFSFQHDEEKELQELLTLPRKRMRSAGTRPEHYLLKLPPAPYLREDDKKATWHSFQLHLLRYFRSHHPHLLYHFRHYQHCLPHYHMW